MSNIQTMTGAYIEAIYFTDTGDDLWLTRNGHGTGFWGRDDSVYGETPIKDIFTAMAKAMGEHYSEFKE